MSLEARCSCDGDDARMFRQSENFARDEFFVAERKLDLKDKMRASVKEVQKLPANAKKAVGSAGRPSYGVAAKRSRSSRRGARAGSAEDGDRSFSPGFVKSVANVPGEQLGNRRI